MSKALQRAILEAIASSGKTDKANKAYLEFTKANFMIPVDIHSSDDAPEVLFLTEQGATYLPVFSDRIFLDKWAKDIAERIKILELSGVDLLKGLGENITVCLDPGSPHYKEFLPEEIARMRSLVLKLFRN